MPISSSAHVPRAGIDPIVSAAEALAVLHLSVTLPCRNETLAMFLDVNDCGTVLVNVADTGDPLHIVEVGETMAIAATNSAEITGLVLASVRPYHGLLPGDDELLLHVNDVVSECGMLLMDWFVIGADGDHSLFQEFGIPPRWSAPDHARAQT